MKPGAVYPFRRSFTLDLVAKVYVWPADEHGCGMLRMAWPARALAAAGHDITITFPKDRWSIGAKLDRTTGKVATAVGPEDADVHVLQRTTHRYLVDAIPFWQAQGRRVIVDIDDDLSCIHPSNPAWEGLRPDPANAHNWNNLVRAAQLADMVTVTTPALARRYRADAVLLPNCLPEHYYGHPRTDSTTIGWPATIRTHPNDADPLGPTLERVVRETGASVRMIGIPAAAPHYRAAFGLRADPQMTPAVGIAEWPAFLAGIGIGIAPLADTVFNRSKSHLKILELSAAGVPWVASPRADYRRFHEETGAGLLADRPNAWRAALKRLVLDADHRAEQSAAVRSAAEAYRLRDHAWRWAAAWGLDEPAVRPRTAPVRAVAGAALGVTG